MSRHLPYGSVDCYDWVVWRITTIFVAVCLYSINSIDPSYLSSPSIFSRPLIFIKSLNSSVYVVEFNQVPYNSSSSPRFFSLHCWIQFSLSIFRSYCVHQVIKFFSLCRWIICIHWVVEIQSSPLSLLKSFDAMSTLSSKLLKALNHGRDPDTDTASHASIQSAPTVVDGRRHAIDPPSPHINEAIAAQQSVRARTPMEVVAPPIDAYSPLNVAFTPRSEYTEEVVDENAQICYVDVSPGAPREETRSTIFSSADENARRQLGLLHPSHFLSQTEGVGLSRATLPSSRVSQFGLPPRNLQSQLHKSATQHSTHQSPTSVVIGGRIPMPLRSTHFTTYSSVW